MTAPYFSFIDPNQTDPLAAIQSSLPSTMPNTVNPRAPQNPAMAMLPSAPDPSKSPVGLLTRLFAGTDPLASGLLQPQEANTLGRNALLQAGLSLLQNSGPAPYKRGLGELLGTALQTGQQAYQQGVAGTVGAQQTVAQRLAQSRLAALRMRYAGRTDPESMRAYMMGLIGEGDYHGASAISELLKSQHGADTRGVLTEIPGPNGTLLQQFRDPTTGQPIGEAFAKPTPPADAGSREQQAADLFDARQFVQLHADPATRKAVQSFRLFQNHLHEAQTGNQEAYKSLISAFAANADPNNQLRLGMLQFLSNLDPSVQGQARILTQKLESGTIPPEDLARLDALVTGNYNAARTAYQNAYDDQVARSGPGVARHIPRTDEIFGRTGSSGANRVRGLIGGP